jgi:2-dehydropantoate 2-reductase
VEEAMKKRIAIMGAGAVGGYVGGHMARNGEDVTLIDPWPAHVDYIRAHGLELSGLTEAERFTVRTPAMHLTEVQGLLKQRPIDIAFVCVKSYDTAWATMMIKDYLAPEGFIVSLQNCMNEETIAGVIGWGKTVGCIASSISVELDKPGHIKRTVPLGGAKHTVFRAGEVHGRITPRVEEVARLVGYVDSAKTTTNLWGERWSKLCLNGMRNGLSAATGMGGNACDRLEVTRRFAIRLAAEAVRVGRALGYTLEDIQHLDPDLFVAAGEGNRAALDRVETHLVTAAAGKSDAQRPSMGQDMVKGRRTEIEYINGFIAAKGEEVGIPAPGHAALTALVKRIERGELQPGPEHIERIVMSNSLAIAGQ